LATKHNVLILGAFDRFNYGDLLFPIIIEKQLTTYGYDFDPQFFGIVRSDLSAVGGKPTQNIRDFYRICDTAEGRTSVIVAGGEAVAVTWNSLLLSLNKLFKSTHRFHGRLAGIVDLNTLARRILGGKTELPFVLTKTDFRKTDQVIYNSLGGSELDPAIFDRFPELAQRLRHADYFAVRDRATQEKLQSHGIFTQLFPDSAILMSKFFPLETLVRLASAAVQQYVAQNRRSYMFFQVKYNHAKSNEMLIADQLDRITAGLNLSLCMCPIGIALNHDDHLAVRRIAPRLKSKAMVFDAVSIWDVMYLIANARVYAGTSLHGAITAMSYAIPYVGLEVTKLNSYLATWGVGMLRQSVQFGNLAQGVLRAIGVDQQQLDQSRRVQLEAAEKSFSLIKQKVFTI